MKYIPQKIDPFTLYSTGVPEDYKGMSLSSFLSAAFGEFLYFGLCSGLATLIISMVSLVFETHDNSVIYLAFSLYACVIANFVAKSEHLKSEIEIWKNCQDIRDASGNHRKDFIVDLVGLKFHCTDGDILTVANNNRTKIHAKFKVKNGIVNLSLEELSQEVIGGADELVKQVRLKRNQELE